VPPQDPETARWLDQHVQPHEPMLRAWLHSRFPQLTEVDDIVQEAYARLMAARAKHEVRLPKAFFFATARNLALDFFRSRRIAGAESLGGDDELSVLDAGEDVAETVARNQEIELMTQAIHALPDRCRQVMTLRNVYGLPQKEIAAQLGISVRTVEAQVTIGIKRCTEFVRRRCRS
jgi:RNA polymerase sigma-70 factor (ECF subfamily)